MFVCTSFRGMTWEAAPFSPWINAAENKGTGRSDKNWDEEEKKVETSVDPIAVGGSCKCKGEDKAQALRLSCLW